jgi:flagellar hook protein FlgE
MPSFSIPLSGLNADSTALNTIANNLSNMNTTAFKSQTTTFADLFYQQLGASGAGNPLLAGLGVRANSTETDFARGSINTDGNSAHMAINGDGFFVVQANGQPQNLTRAGNFQVDQNGFLVTQDGEKVLGYTAAGASGSLTGLQIPVGGTNAPQATGNVSLTTSLDASAASGASVVAPVTIYDSLGQSHQLSITFTKSATPNQWTYSVAIPAGDFTGAATATTGTVTFDSAGNLTSPSSLAGIGFAGLADGAAALNLTLNFANASGNPTLTQTVGTSSTSTSQDGHPSGTYQGFTVDPSGVLSAVYSNGNVAKVGQVALAHVNNEQALARIGGNDYQVTGASGQIQAGVAGSGGLGTLADQSLEAPNVDISAEFSNLIVAQRAFEANSKSITTFDTVSQDTISMIR